MPRQFAHSEHLLILPVVLGLSLGDYEIHFDVRLADQPPLPGVILIRSELDHLTSGLPGLDKTKGHAAGDTPEAHRAVRPC